MLTSCTAGSVGTRGAFSAEVTNAQDHWSGVVRRIATGAIARRISDIDCTSVWQATELSLSLIAAQAREPLPVETVSPRPPKDTGALMLTVAAGSAAFVTPQVQALLALKLWWQWHSLALAIGGTLALPNAQTVGPGNADMWLVLGEATVGYHAELVQQWLGLTAGGAIWLGAAFASTRGLDQNRHPSAFIGWVGPQASLRGEVSTRWGWWFEAGLPIALVAPGFVVTGFGPILGTASVGVLATTGIFVKWQ